MEIYMGCLDDQVAKYPWPKLKYDLPDYLDELMCQIIIGRKPIINDGYIIQNKILRDNLLKKEGSFLLDLVQSGAVAIAGRSDSFSSLIEIQIEGKVPDFVTMNDEIKKKFEGLDKKLGRTGRITAPQSEELWEGFYNLIKSTGDRSLQDLGIDKNCVSERNFLTAIEKFISPSLQDETTRTPSRGQWEKILEKMVLDNQLICADKSKIALMNFANEAYHYNFAKLFSLHQNRNIAVQTALSPAFSYLIRRNPDYPQTESLGIPLITVPWPNKILRKESLEDLMGNTDLGQKRCSFVNALNAFQANPALTQNLAELRNAATFYNAAIAENLSCAEELKHSMAYARLGLAALTSLFDPTGASLVLQWVLQEKGIIADIMQRKTKRIDYLGQRVIASTIRSYDA